MKVVLNIHIVYHTHMHIVSVGTVTRYWKSESRIM
jgi:hypothetical protein